MAIINLFNGTFKGSVIMTGNSNGLSTTNTPPEGIGTFTVGLPGNTPPNGGTTGSFLTSSSSGQLVLPAGSTVRSAQLLWSGSASNGTSGQSIGNGTQNNNITLRAPDGTVFNVTPTVANRQVFGTISTTSNSTYSNAADVTSIVSAKGAGFYTIGTVPSILGVQGQHNGWILIVAYENQLEPFRNMNIWTALEPVAGGGGVATVNISGFSTPSTGTPQGRIIFAGGNGNSNLVGDSAFFGPTLSTLATLSGPNNPATNFFASQINNNNGAQDTTGTFGNRNTPLGSTSTNGNRNNWDITRVDASPGLVNNQTSGVIRVATASDSIWLTGLGLQVDVNSANLTPLTKSVDRQFAEPGELLVFTLTTVNSGLVTANNVIFVDTIPTGTTFVAGSVILNNTSQPALDPSPPSGFNVGNIGSNVVTTIQFTVKVNDSRPPTVNPINNEGTVIYSFVPAPGLDTIPASTASNITTTTIVAAVLSSSKIVNKTFANVGDILTYTIPITNTGNTSGTNVIFLDTIPNDTTLVSGSFKQDGVNISGTPSTPGTTLPNNIGVGRTSTITFQVRITTIPNPNPIPNTASIKYYYTIDSTTTPNRIGNNSSNTNTVNTQVNNANLGNIIKLTDKSYATCGEEIEYKIIIPNIGNVTAQSIIFKDTIPNGTSFVTDSVYINGSQSIGSNPNTGFSIPNIAPGTTTTITFSVKVVC